MTTRQPQKAFTLVELLAVLVLMALLSAMVVTATNGVTRSARESRTKAIIAAVDSVVQERYRSYKYRPLAVEIPDTFNPASFTTGASTAEIGFEVLGSEAARVRLMMVRDLQRMELPDRLSDISSPPALIRAAASPILRNTSTDAIINTRNDKTQRRMFPVNWYNAAATFASGSDNVPSKMAAYRERIRTLEGLSGSSFNFTSAAALTHQGAECLYLIMATSFVGGRPAIDSIPAANVADTDGDGLLEILDGWGQPLGFVRWPVGAIDFEQSIVISAAPTAATPDLTPVPDDFDLFRTDYAYFIDPSISTAAVPFDVNVAVSSPELKPWSMRPLIFSNGANKASGIATNPWTTAGEVGAYSYQASAWNWPVTVAYCGAAESPGRNRGIGAATYTEHPFPDPYLRRFVAANGGTGFSGRLPGQILSGTLATEDASDNITNYQLQATPR